MQGDGTPGFLCEGGGHFVMHRPAREATIRQLIVWAGIEPKLNRPKVSATPLCHLTSDNTCPRASEHCGNYLLIYSVIVCETRRENIYRSIGAKFRSAKRQNASLQLSSHQYGSCTAYRERRKSQNLEKWHK